MAKISLKTLTDDILLLVRNCNISESEDLSRSQIHAWIKAYKNQLWREERYRRKMQAKQNQLLWEDLGDDTFIKRIEIGPLELVSVKDIVQDEQKKAIIEEADELIPSNTKVTKDPIPDVLDNDPKSILAVHDHQGEVIQYMDHTRRHYNYWRKYTFGEMSAFYKDDGHVYVQGVVDQDRLKYIYVLYMMEIKDDTADGEGDEPEDEDQVEIPAWLVPLIKERIIKNELAFMLNRPSDDSNNATLASVKPHGPQDDEE